MNSTNPQFFGAPTESLQGKDMELSIPAEDASSASTSARNSPSGRPYVKVVAAALAIAAIAGLALSMNVETAPAVDQPRCVGDCQLAAPNAPTEMMKVKTEFFMSELYRGADLASRGEGPQNLTVGATCEDGFAGDMPCKNVNLVSVLSGIAMGSQYNYASDMWGWTDPETNREYAVTCHFEGFSIVDISTPAFPVPLFFIPSSGPPAVWADLKVYENFVFKVSEGDGHGMQVFDLTRVRGRTPEDPERYAIGELSVLEVVAEDALYTEFGSAHNIAINEEEGFAFAVGSRTCQGGFHMVNIREPLRPVFAGCFDEDGYTHDVQCVTYRGPDFKYTGAEICFAFQGGSVTIVDVTVKSAPKILSQSTYPNATYVHQGWVTEDGRFLLVDDELDETRGRNSGFTETIVFNVEDLENPEFLFKYQAPVTSIDHNLYIKGRYAFQSNYNSGLRITDTRPLYHCQELEEVAFLDVFPDNDEVSFQGTWSNYPYFSSGNIILSSMNRGLVVAQLNETYPWY